MVFRITPNLGPELDQQGPGYYDLDSARATPQLGVVVRGDDGGEYRWVSASAAIAATATTGTRVILTFPANTVATGAGEYWTPPGVPVASGAATWVRRGAYNAAPA